MGKIPSPKIKGARKLFLDDAWRDEEDAYVTSVDRAAVIAVEFAMKHVQAALEAAASKSKTKVEIMSSMMGAPFMTTVDKESILNAYPLTNIK